MPFSPKVARPWANGYFELVLDGVECGIVNNFGGLDISADTAKIPQSTLYLIKNQLTGNLKFADADLQCGLSMGLPFKDWVKASLDSAHVYKNGEMRVADYNRKVVQAREFTNALITEVGFPKCDANGKDVAFLNVKFAVEQTKYKAGDGATVQKPNSTNQTMFTPTNFRLTIDGLEDTCAKVSTVEALTVKQKVQRDNVGPLKIYDLIPTGLEQPNLKISFNENVVKPISDWFESFVIAGKNDVSQEKGGLLEYLDQSLQKVLLAIEFKGLGIFNLTRNKISNNEDKVAACTAEMYCDEITIKSWA